LIFIWIHNIYDLSPTPCVFGPNRRHISNAPGTIYSLYVLKLPLITDQPTNIEDDKSFYEATGCKVISVEPCICRASSHQV